jgi:hypothetical protein
MKDGSPSRAPCSGSSRRRLPSGPFGTSRGGAEPGAGRRTPTTRACVSQWGRFRVKTQPKLRADSWLRPYLGWRTIDRAHRLDQEAQCVPTSTSVSPARPGLLTSREAASWLRISARQLADRDDLPRLDIAESGSRRPQWRYRPADLESFAASRVILPYTPRAMRQA